MPSKKLHQYVSLVASVSATSKRTHLPLADEAVVGALAQACAYLEFGTVTIGHRYAQDDANNPLLAAVKAFGWTVEGETIEMVDLFESKNYPNGRAVFVARVTTTKGTFNTVYERKLNVDAQGEITWSAPVPHGVARKTFTKYGAQALTFFGYAARILSGEKFNLVQDAGELPVIRPLDEVSALEFWRHSYETQARIRRGEDRGVVYAEERAKQVAAVQEKFEGVKIDMTAAQKMAARYNMTLESACQKIADAQGQRR